MGSTLTGRVVGYLAAAGAGILIGAGGFAIAASSDSVIQACAKRGSGLLRIASHCGPRERAVAWNVEGRQGPQGLQGVRGQQGPQGLQGAQGPVGGSTWILVSKDGSVITSHGNVGSTTVSRESTGTYCILPGTTPAWVAPSDENHPVTAQGFGGDTQCNGPFSHVTMYNPATGNLVDNGFVLFLPQ